MRRSVDWWNARQVPLYLAAIGVGGVAGLIVPQFAPALSVSITPALALLLFATFLGVPLLDIARALRDVRFLGTILVVNFVVAPLVAFALSRFVADDRGLQVGLLLVLLTPCVDYVIVFTKLAGGSASRLLAATPLLMVVQIVLLPLYLLLFAGADAVASVDLAPFAQAFVSFIVIPLAAAAVVQALARRHRVGVVVERGFAGAMVPLMMVTLAVVIGSQIAAVGSQALVLVRLVPLYAVFMVVMVAVGVGVAAGVSRRSTLDVEARRAVVFSGVTRNSLVVLPLALALPSPFGIAPLAVVTQTLVELFGLVVLVRLVPWLVRERPRPAPRLTGASLDRRLRGAMRVRGADSSKNRAVE